MQFFHDISRMESEFFQRFELALDYNNDPYGEIERDFSRKGWE